MLRLSSHLTITSLSSEAFSFSSFQDKPATFIQQMLSCAFQQSAKVLIVRCFTISPFVSGRLLLSAVPGWHTEANVSPLSGVRPIIPSSLSELCVSVLTFAIPLPLFSHIALFQKTPHFVQAPLLLLLLLSLYHSFHCSCCESHRLQQVTCAKV